MALPFKFMAKSIVEEGRTTQEAIDTIKKWLDANSVPPLQEEFIVLFLLSSFNDICATKKTIEAYFRIKSKTPHIFDTYDLESAEIKNIFKVFGACMVPIRMPNNVAVICHKIYDRNYRNFDLVAAIKICCMYLHCYQISNPPSEIVLVADMKEVGFMHLTRLRMGSVLPFLEYIQEGVPIKIKSIHVFNSNYVCEQAIALFKFFLNSDLLNSIYLYQAGIKMDEFYQKWVPAAFLPKEFGGNLSSFDVLASETLEGLKEMQPFFNAERNLRSSYET